MAYQTAVSLWIFEGTLLWSKYNAMLVANSIVLAATGFAADSALPAVFRKGLPVVGILLCVLWFQLTARGMDYHTYWILSARELEEMYLPKGVTTVSRGGPFADGKLVSLTIDGHSVQVRMGRVGRLSKTAWSSNLTVVCFLVLYVFLLV